MSKKKTFTTIVSEAGLAQLAGRKDASEVPITFQLVAATKIQPNPFQPRIQVNQDEITELANSIVESGMIQPLTCRLEEDGNYTLITGQRRLEAARISGLTLVPVIERKVSDDELLSQALIENIHRKDLHPVDEARALGNHLNRLKGNESHAAKAIGMDRTTFIRKVKPMELGEEVLDICARISDLTWKQLLRLLDLSPDRRLAAAHLLARQETTETIKKADSPKKQNLSYKITTQSKSTVVIDLRSRKKNLPRSEFIEALTELLEKLRQEEEGVHREHLT
ncbi:MAG: ParB/RepB/Spo0J family partition protein [Blastocatellia bacterium]|nr:ParB/RepB/Spo0J family partition protein [Blastocatellia bacterium]